MTDKDNIEKIPRIKEIDEVVKRYPRLHTSVRRMLTDYFNHWVGFDSMTYGEEWQREYFLENIKGRESPYTLHFTHPRIFESIKNNLEKKNNKDSEFSQEDLGHLIKLEKLVDYTNIKAKENDLTRQVVHNIYTHLMPYLYGNKTKRVLKKKID